MTTTAPQPFQIDLLQSEAERAALKSGHNLLQERIELLYGKPQQ
jgi:hypothetical protein